MRRFGFVIGTLAILCAAVAIFFVLRSEKALVTHPAGIISQRELEVIGIVILLMLIVVVPTYILLFATVWKQRSQKKVKAIADPEHSHSAFGEIMMWVIPFIVIVVMAVHNWNATHELDPFKPLKSNEKPLTIQVIALDWKWLFIYPEQGIATVNFVQFPEHTPIHFFLTGDGAPMNSFWIPQLSGQIYAMTGMATQLHLIADKRGEYRGRAAEMNGMGYSDMTFVAKATSQSEFEQWVEHISQSSEHLTHDLYRELAAPSVKNPVAFYSNVEKGIFNNIMMTYMNPQSQQQ